MNISLNYFNIQTPKVHLIFYLLISLILGILKSWLLFFCYYLFTIHTLRLKSKTINLIKQLSSILVFFFIGIYLHQNQRKDFIEFKNSVENKTFNIRGTIKKIDYNESHKIIVLKLKKLKQCHEKKWLNCNKKVQLYIRKFNKLAVDDLIEFSNVKFVYGKNLDFENYLIKESVNASLYLNNLKYKILKKPVFSIARFIHSQKLRIYYNLRNKIKQNCFTFFSSIFLGNKTVVKSNLNKYKEYFNNWGLSHYLARSGLHLAIISLLLFGLISAFFVPYKIKSYIILLFIFIYFLFSWENISFVRSLLMFFFYKFCSINNLQINSFHLLNCACLIILLINPMQLFFLDFQLTFSLTYGLILISQKTNK